MSPRELKDIGLLADFHTEDREALLAVLEEQELPAGACLFREGDEASCLYLVGQGAFELESDRAPALGVLGPGAWMGAASLVAFGRRQATARACEPARVWRLDRFALRRLSDDAPRTACRLLEAIAADLADAVRDTLDRVLGVDPGAGDP